MHKLLLLCSFISISCYASAPVKDRAVVERMEATIRLPDQSSMVVDMDFDCGSDFASTAMIITSDHGAKMLAELYSHRYGPAAGKKVMKTWNSKKKPSDPRKPTFLIVRETPPQPTSLTKTTEAAEMQSVEYAESIIGFCGTREHPNNRLN